MAEMPSNQVASTTPSPKLDKTLELDFFPLQPLVLASATEIVQPSQVDTVVSVSASEIPPVNVALAADGTIIAASAGSSFPPSNTPTPPLITPESESLSRTRPEVPPLPNNQVFIPAPATEIAPQSQANLHGLASAWFTPPAAPVSPLSPVFNDHGVHMPTGSGFDQFVSSVVSNNDDDDDRDDGNAEDDESVAPLLVDASGDNTVPATDEETSDFEGDPSESSRLPTSSDGESSESFHACNNSCRSSDSSFDGSDDSDSSGSGCAERAGYGKRKSRRSHAPSRKRSRPSPPEDHKKSESVANDNSGQKAVELPGSLVADSHQSLDYSGIHQPRHMLDEAPTIAASDTQDRELYQQSLEMSSDGLNTNGTSASSIVAGCNTQEEPPEQILAMSSDGLNTNGTSASSVAAASNTQEEPPEQSLEMSSDGLNTNGTSASSVAAGWNAQEEPPEQILAMSSDGLNTNGTSASSVAAASNTQVESPQVESPQVEPPQQNLAMSSDGLNTNGTSAALLDKLNLPLEQFAPELILPREPSFSAVVYEAGNVAVGSSVLDNDVSYKCSGDLEVFDDELTYNRFAEQNGRFAVLIPNRKYLVCLKGRWFPAQFIKDADEDGNRHFFKFSSGMSKRAFPSCKVMDFVTEPVIGGIGVSRAATIKLKKGVQVCKRLVKGDAVQLTDGSDAFVYYNNHYSMCLMVLSVKKARRVCYSEVVSFHRVDLWDCWKTKEYLKSESDASYYNHIRHNQKPLYIRKRKCTNVKARGFTEAPLMDPFLAGRHCNAKKRGRNRSAKVKVVKKRAFAHSESDSGVTDGVASAGGRQRLKKRPQPQRKSTTAKRRRVSHGSVAANGAAEVVDNGAADVVDNGAADFAFSSPGGGARHLQKKKRGQQPSGSGKVTKPIDRRAVVAHLLDDGHTLVDGRGAKLATKEDITNSVRHYASKTVRLLKAEMALQLLPIATHLLQYNSPNVPFLKLTSNVPPATVAPTADYTVITASTSSNLPPSKTPLLIQPESESQPYACLEVPSLPNSQDLQPRMTSQECNTSLRTFVDAAVSAVNGTMTEEELLAFVKEELFANGVPSGDAVDPILGFLVSEVKNMCLKQQATGRGRKASSRVVNAILKAVPSVDSLVRRDPAFRHFTSEEFQQEFGGGDSPSPSNFASSPVKGTTAVPVWPLSDVNLLCSLSAPGRLNDGQESVSNTNEADASNEKIRRCTVQDNNDLGTSATPNGGLQLNSPVVVADTPSLTSVPFTTPLTVVSSSSAVAPEVAKPVCDPESVQHESADESDIRIDEGAPQSDNAADVSAQDYIPRSTVQSNNGKFNWSLVSAAIASNAAIVIDGATEGLWAARLESGCVVYAADEITIPATKNMINAGITAITRMKPKQDNVLEKVKTFLKGYMVEEFKDFPKPVQFGYAFKGIYAEVSDPFSIHLAYKEPFKSAIEQAVIYLQDQLCGKMSTANAVRVVADAVNRCMSSQKNHSYYQRLGAKAKNEKRKQRKAKSQKMMLDD